MSVSSRSFVITIAAIAGGVVGVFLTGVIFPFGLWDIRVGHIDATGILMYGRDGYVSLDTSGISLERKDYSGAVFLLNKPVEGKSSAGGPVLWIHDNRGWIFKAPPDDEALKSERESP